MTVFFGQQRACLIRIFPLRCASEWKERKEVLCETLSEFFFYQLFGVLPIEWTRVGEGISNLEDFDV